MGLVALATEALLGSLGRCAAGLGRALRLVPDGTDRRRQLRDLIRASPGTDP